MIKYNIGKHKQLSLLEGKPIYVLWAETEYSCRGIFQGTKLECEEEKKKRLGGK